jgi:hypothetical protein
VYESGGTLEQLSATYSYPPETIKRFLKTIGVIIRKKRTPDETRRLLVNVVEHYQSGLSIRQIAIRSGLCHSQVSRTLRENGVKIASVSSALERKANAILRDRRSGLSLTKICRKHHVWSEAVKRLLKQHGLWQERMPLDENGERAIAAMYLEGVKIKEIVKTTHHDHRTVSQVLRKFGVEVRTPLQSTTRRYGFVGKYNGYLFRSLMELSYILDNEANHKIVCAERLASIKYSHLGRRRNYYPDFLVDDKMLIEIKPKSYFNDPGVLAKKAAAERFCDEKGWTYKMLEWPVNWSRIIELVKSGVVVVLNREMAEVESYLQKNAA